MTGFLGALGVGGSAQKTDRKQTLTGFGDLSNLFNFGMNTGKAATGAASDQLGQAGGYYSKLLSGDRATTLQAVAPTVNAATAQTDAAKRGIAESGTARGGGVNSTTQTLEDQKRAGIDTAIGQAKSGAAAGATATGGTMASQASNLLGMGETAAANLTDSSISSRKLSNEITQQQQGKIDSVLSSIADANPYGISDAISKALFG